MVPMMFKSKYFYKFQLIRTIYNSTAHYLKLIIIIFFIYFTVKKKKLVVTLLEFYYEFLSYFLCTIGLKNKRIKKYHTSV